MMARAMLSQALVVLVATSILLSAGADDVTHLEVDKAIEAEMAWGDSQIYCYTPPFGNIGHFFNEVSIEVSATEGVPSVYGASRDDVHGIIDAWIKSQAAGSDFDGAVAVRARNKDDFATPLDLLHECPPVWDSNAQACTKAFSPFGPSCVAVTMRKRAQKLTFTVKATSKFQKALPGAMALGALILWFAKYLAKSKVVWYTSGVSISVGLGLLVLLIFACRKIKVPGANRTGFTIVSAMGYGAVCIRYVASVLKAAAAKYWQLLAVYCFFFACLGMVHIARVRRSEERKHDFRITVLWAARLLGVTLIVRGTRSSLCGLAITASLLVYYAVTRFSIGKSSKGDSKKQR